MKTLIVHEITIEKYDAWPNMSTYPKPGVYLVSCQGLNSFLVNAKVDMVLYIGEATDEYFIEEEKVNTLPVNPIKSFESIKEKETGMVSEDFALQMLSVALHKQKV